MEQETVGNIFRAYDIRGIYGEDLFPETAERIGKSACLAFGSGSGIVVGMDARESGGTLKEGLINGIMSAGCNVIDIGMAPSPVLYFSVKHTGASGGIMVTASHLPPEWNGFKFCGRDGIVISEGTGLEKIREEFLIANKKEGSQGSRENYRDILLDYMEYILGRIKIKRKLKAVFDYGNSVTSLAMHGIIRQLPVDALEINRALKPSSPDRSSELTEEALTGLRIAVLESGSDIGIAYDGDGDRVAFVDRTGRILNSGNILIPLFAGHYLSGGKGGKIVYDITCSNSVSEFISSRGGESIITRVGHSYCASEVLKSGAVLGGQYSGHMVFPEIGCADDAMYASMKMLEILSTEQKKLEEMVREIPSKFSTEVFEYRVPDDSKFGAIRKICEIVEKTGLEHVDIDGIKILTEHGWVLIRASNTSPVIKINAESEIPDEADTLLEYGKNLVKEAIPVD